MVTTVIATQETVCDTAILEEGDGGAGRAALPGGSNLPMDIRTQGL